MEKEDAYNNMPEEGGFIEYAGAAAKGLVAAGALLATETGKLAMRGGRAAYQKTKAWLQSVYEEPYKHKANIVLGATLLGTNAVTGIHRFGTLGQLTRNIIAGIGAIETTLLLSNTNIGTEVYREMNAILDELKDPNIGGIPIHAESEVESQDCEVQQHLLIQQSQENKSYKADNSVPKPKTWTIQGYLMAARDSLDSVLTIKPSLMLQRQLLQHYIDLRMPVVFKTHDNRFYTVLVTHMDTQYTIQGLNALRISITLTEFNTMVISANDISMEDITMTPTGEA